MSVTKYTDSTVFKLVEENINDLSKLPYKQLRTEIDKLFLHKTFVGLKNVSGTSKNTLFGQIHHVLNTKLMTLAKRSIAGRILLKVVSRTLTDNIVGRARSRKDKEVRSDLSDENVLELTTVDRNKQGQPTVKLLKRLPDSELAIRNSREVRSIQTRSANSKAKWDAVAEVKGFSHAEAATKNLTSLSDIDTSDDTVKSTPRVPIRRNRTTPTTPNTSPRITGSPIVAGPKKPKGPKGPKSPNSPITSEGGPSKNTSSRRPSKKKSGSRPSPRRPKRRR